MCTAGVFQVCFRCVSGMFQVCFRCGRVVVNGVTREEHLCYIKIRNFQRFSTTLLRFSI